MAFNWTEFSTPSLVAGAVTSVAALGAGIWAYETGSNSRAAAKTELTRDSYSAGGSYGNANGDPLITGATAASNDLAAGALEVGGGIVALFGALGAARFGLPLASRAFRNYMEPVPTRPPLPAAV